MAISLKTAGSWARMVTDNGTVTIPGSPAAGDRMFLFGTWKTFSVTATPPNGWNIIDDFSDGSVAAGNGSGSVHNAVWYRDWQAGDAAPAIDYSAAPTEGHWVIMLWQKGGADVWGVPTAVHAAISAADPWSATSSATITVPDGGVVMSLVGLSDDSTTIARSTTTAIGDDGSPTVTWNGNYVESPATHFTSTTGLDMAGDLGHRLVTTGAAGVNLTSTGDPAAAETGTVTWVVQGLAQAVTGTGGIAISAPGNTSSGAETMTGDAAADIDAPTVSATGTETMTATGGVALAAPGVSASGAETMTATGAVAFAAPGVAGTGESVGGDVTGTGAIAFGAPGVGVSAAETMTGSAVLTFAASAVAAAAAETFLGTGAVAIDAPTVAGSGTSIAPVTGSGGVTFVAPTLDGSGLVMVPVVGEGAFMVPASLVLGNAAIEVPSASQTSVVAPSAPGIVRPEWLWMNVSGRGRPGVSGPRLSGSGTVSDDELLLELLRSIE